MEHGTKVPLYNNGIIMVYNNKIIIINIIIILAFSAQDPNEFFQVAFVFLSFYVQY